MFPFSFLLYKLNFNNQFLHKIICKSLLCEGVEVTDNISVENKLFLWYRVIHVKLIKYYVTQARVQIYR